MSYVPKSYVHPTTNQANSSQLIFFCYFWKNMKAAVILMVMVWTSGLAAAHNYYFGFAEMQYNEVNHTLETTVVLSAHDFEDVLLKKGLISKSLEYLTADSAAIAAVAKEVLQGFELKIGGKSVRFESLGFEVTRNGMINVYLLAENIALSKEFQLSFTCLMDVFPEQQNKMTFIYQSQKYTAVFLQHQKSAVIQLQ